MSPFQPTFHRSPPSTNPSLLLVSFPHPKVLLVTINTPQRMNCLNTAAHWELGRIWRWYDDEPSLRCAIITGATVPGGKRKAFCAGQDLKEWKENKLDAGAERLEHPPGGFGGLSRRTGRKLVVAAVDGVCLGGGFEMICNVDLTLATPTSTFAFPETSRGVVPFAGALPRLMHIIGSPRASELVFLNRVLTAKEALEWGLINKVVGEGENVVDEAVKWATKLAEEISPDAVIVTRRGLRLAWSGLGVEAATREAEDGPGGREELEKGLNIKEGLRAFAEKRKPKWVDSKL